MARRPKRPAPQAPPSSSPPPATPIILPGAAGGVAGTVPGSAAAATSMAAGAGGEATLAIVAKNAAAAVLATLVRLSRRRIQAMRERMLRAGAKPGDVERALAAEGERELIYQRRADERVKAGMKLALRASDAGTRAAAVQSVLQREQRFAQMRASAAAERVLASAELEELRRISPKGAFWRLGKRRTHTTDCLAMAGHFWPWSVLNEVHPLLHTGCGCYLISLGTAIAEGLMAAGDVPTDAAAKKLAAGVIAHVRAEREENRRLYGLEEAATRELVIRERLAEFGVGDLDQLACAPLRADAELAEAYNPAQKRDRAGKWTKGINVVGAGDFAKAIAAVFKGNPRSTFLSPYTEKDYKGMRTFLSKDGKTGGALKPGPDGSTEIVSVFNAPDGQKGGGKKMMERLISEGGDRLDCLGDGLRGYYEKLGFKVTETMEWDDQYAPAGWDYKAHGRPNVYVMSR